MSSYLSGTVHTVLFSDETQPFYIVRLTDDEGNLVVAKGAIIGPAPKPGSWLGADGAWENDPKFGRQFKIARAPVLKGGMTPDAAENLLHNQGVGPATTTLLRAALGEGFMASLEDEAAVASVKGVTPFAAAQVAAAWRRVRAFFGAVPKLEEMGFGTRDINRIFTLYGDEAPGILTSDPWSLVEVPGFDFTAADALAGRMGIPMGSPARIRGACSYAVRSARRIGHMFLPLSALLSAVRDILGSGVSGTELAAALKEGSDGGRLLIDRGVPGMGTLVYSPEMHRFEERAAAALAERAAAVSSLAPLGNGDPRAFYESAAQEAMRSLDIDLTDKQLNGVVSALVCPVSVITGLPGTGKTTSLRVLVKALQIAGVRTSDPDKGPSHDSGCLLMAPTGIAAKRITHVTGAGASTIHRALGGTPGSVARRESVYEGVLGEAAGSRPGSGDSVWSYGAGNTHPARIVVVDEASMLDAELLWRVLDGTRPDAHVVFVGDAAQLPSVGPGNVMRDLVSCGTFPTTDLREIFRQEEASDIVVAAHAIHGGEDPPLGGDFRLLLCRDEAAALEVVKRVVQRLYDGRANFQVLSPRHGGTAGVTNLNSDLRDMINPSGAGSREIRIASGYVREGDRVMVVQNDYDLGVYNGDVGKVTGIDLKRKRIEVKIHGPSPYRISTDIKTAARLLRLAYAQTVHKSQGQEYDVIVLPILDSHGVQLQRNLFYTAVTRAKKKVILVGQESALRRAIANDKQAGRYTALAQRIHAATEQGGPPSHRSRKGEEGETPDTGRTE